MADSLALKWGTLKGWHIENNERAMECLRRYHDEPTSISVMAQRDTDGQKAAICDLIDALSDDSTIYNDWSGATMTKDEAKTYVLEYGKPRPAA